MHVGALHEGLDADAPHDGLADLHVFDLMQGFELTLI